jgi:ankyrin repeat protein
MTPNDDTRDEELLARYRRASEDAAGPSGAVRAAILAESRRVAAELAKQASPPTFDVSRPAANDSRWKIPAFGTVGAALLAALIFAPRYWEHTPPAQVSMAPAPAPASVPAQAEDKAEAPKLEEVKPSAPRSRTEPALQSPSESTSLQEMVVTRADRKSAKTYGVTSPQHETATPPPPASVAQNYAPVSPSASNLVVAPAAPPSAAARLRSPDVSAGAASDALSVTAGHPSRAESLLKPATLQSAVAQGDVAQAAALLDQGAVIDARDEAGRTPLMLAVTQGQIEIVRLLLARGADPNTADNAGHTPLQQARQQNSREIVALLEGWQRARSAR